MTALCYGTTDADGRVKAWTTVNRDTYDLKTETSTYTLVFSVADYYDRLQVEHFFPIVEVTFNVKAGEKYHVPLLLNPYSYSTYRGS